VNPLHMIQLPGFGGRHPCETEKVELGGIKYHFTLVYDRGRVVGVHVDGLKAGTDQQRHIYETTCIINATLAGGTTVQDLYGESHVDGDEHTIISHVLARACEEEQRSAA